jgi:hypothetical protein
MTTWTPDEGYAVEWFRDLQTPRRWNPSADNLVITKYVQGHINGNLDTTAKYGRYVNSLMQTRDGWSALKDGVLAAIILPLLDVYAAGMPSGIVMPVLVGLMHPDCPTNVLDAACRCTRMEYRSVAAAHDNCPEDAVVYAFLLNENDPRIIREY